MRKFKSIITNQEYELVFHQDVNDNNVQIDIEDDIGMVMNILLESDELDVIIEELTRLKWLLQDAEKESSKAEG